MNIDIDPPLVPPLTSGELFDAQVMENIRQRKIWSPFLFPSSTTLESMDVGALIMILGDTIRESPHTDEVLSEISSRSIQGWAEDGSLASAYQSGSFWDLLNQSGIFLPSVTGDRVSVVPSSSDSSLKSAFEAEYRGDTHKLLIGILKGEWELRSGDEPAKRFYDLAMPVVQSSGMGKSRMVDEASKLIFTIPINLGERLGEEVKTCPPPDDGIRQYFIVHLGASDIELQTEYAILLRVLFDEVVRLLDTDRFRGLSGESLAREWSEYLRAGGTDNAVGENRRALLDAAAKRATNLKASGI